MTSTIPVTNTSTTINLTNEYAYIPKGIVVGVAAGLAINVADVGRIGVDGTAAGSIAIQIRNVTGVYTSTIIVGVEGTLWGQSYAIYSDNGTASAITNAGHLYATVAIFMANNSHTVTNTGTISADHDVIISANAQLMLVNTGTIFTYDPVNHYAAYLGAQWDTIINAGSMTGMVLMGAGNDKVDTHSGIIQGTIDLGADQDTCYGSAQADSIIGGTGNDTLAGNAGNDSIDGGADRDSIDGGLGNDSLTGGTGVDIFYFTTKLGSSNVDTIADFKLGGEADKMALDNAVMAALGSTAATLASGKFYAAAGATHGHDKDDRIVYNKSNGWLYYDSDGSGSHAAVHFATLTGHPTLSASDFSVV